MKLRSWLTGLVVAVAAPLIAVQAYQFLILKEMVSESEHLVRVEAETLRRLGTLRALADEHQRLAGKASLLDDADYQEASRLRSRQISAALARLIDLQTEPTARAGLRTLRRRWEDAGEFTGFLTELNYQLEAARERVAIRLAEAGAESADALRIAALALGLTLPAALAGALLLARSTSRNLDAVGEAAAGMLDRPWRVPAVRPASAEISKLTDRFAALAGDFRRLERVRCQSIETVSHDLKSPLAGMEETQSALLDGLAGPLGADQRHLLELSLESNRSLRRLVERLLEWSALEQGRVALQYGRCRPREILQEAILQAEVSDPKGPLVRVEDSTGSESRPGWGDHTRLVQVFFNLVANARQHAPRSRRVDVHSSLTEELPDLPPGLSRPGTGRGRWWVVAVLDRGDGIEDDLKSVVFAPHWSRGRRRGRHGLGLAICRRICAAHGGAVWVEDRPGGGSVFKAVLPWSGEPA